MGWIELRDEQYDSMPDTLKDKFEEVRDDGSEREPGPSNERFCVTCNDPCFAKDVVSGCGTVDDSKDIMGNGSIHDYYDDQQRMKSKTPNTLPRPSNKKEQEEDE